MSQQNVGIVRDLVAALNSSAVLRLEGSPAGSPGRMQSRYAFTSEWEAGLITRVIVREDLEEARAEAERLVEGRR